MFYNRPRINLLTVMSSRLESLNTTVMFPLIQISLGLMTVSRLRLISSMSMVAVGGQSEPSVLVAGTIEEHPELATGVA